MGALCTHLRAPLVVALLAGATVAASGACGGGALVVGDDTVSDGGPDGGASDAAPIDGGPADGGPNDAGDAAPDATPGVCAAPSTCVAKGAPCEATDTALACASAGDVCCVTPCPELAQPPPTFCDGGPIASRYDAKGCVVGFACAPTDCATAGGSCVALTPTACKSGHVGDATTYSCGGGLGVECCLP